MGDCVTRRQATNILQNVVGGGNIQHLDEYTNKSEVIAAGANSTPLAKYKSGDELVNIEDIQKVEIDFPIYFLVKLVGENLYFQAKDVGVYFKFNIQFVDNNGNRFIEQLSFNAIITALSGSTFQQIFRLVYHPASTATTKFIDITITAVEINVTHPNNYPTTSGDFVCQYNSASIINKTINFNGPISGLASSIDVTKDNTSNPIQLICKIKMVSA